VKPAGVHRALAWAVAKRLIPTGVLALRGSGGGRRVALTFDDGPDPLTREYLDTLDRHGARATFFVLGQSGAARVDDLRDMERRGHEVAGHGFSHKRFTRMSGAELRAELARTAALLPAGSGQALVRPPHGSTSASSLMRCARAGYRTVLWSVDSEDSRARTATEVVERLAPERLRPGDIILLHEGQTWTLEALPAVLDRLRAAGYACTTVSELLQS
jgi:peptidoglycan/xylan/chitin deacetylase (PgdA/CDA1 family)